VSSVSNTNLTESGTVTAQDPRNLQTSGGGQQICPPQTTPSVSVPSSDLPTINENVISHVSSTIAADSSGGLNPSDANSNICPSSSSNKAKAKLQVCYLRCDLDIFPEKLILALAVIIF